MSLFVEISLILGLVALVVTTLERFRLPPLLGYILVGIFVGPSAFHLIQSTDMLESFSHFGVIILLFIIGIHLSPAVLKELGFRAIAIGCLQVLMSTVLGAGVFFLLDFSLAQSMLLGLTFAFSSTILVLKLLGDAKDLDSLHGRIAIGVLIIQDVIVSFALVFLGNTQENKLLFPNAGLFTHIATIITLCLSLFILQKNVLPKILSMLARNQESLFVFSLAWGFCIASLFSLAGLSLEIGALLAGVILSTSDYAEEISSRLKPLRDFFILIFFVTLGTAIAPHSVLELLVPCVLLVIFVIFVKPLLIVFLMQRFGYHRKTSLKTALSLGQLSEFSFILVALWLKTGWLPASAVTITSVVGILSIVFSTFTIPNLESIEEKLLPFLPNLRKSGTNSPKIQRQYTALLIGYNRVGEQLLTALKKREFKSLIIDFDPKQVEELELKKIKHVYGDAGDLEFLQNLPSESLKVVISTLPTVETNLVVCKYFGSQTNPATLLFFAHSNHDAELLYQAGASFVVVPHSQAAQTLSNLLERFKKKKKRFSRIANLR